MSFVLGLFIGTFLGFVACALMVANRDDDDDDDDGGEPHDPGVLDPVGAAVTR